MEQSSSASARLEQGVSSRIALLMLGVVGATCLILGGLAHSGALGDWIRQSAWKEASWKKQIPMFCYNDHFLDCDDRLLHQDIPSADYSRGGVYFLGASNVAWALKLWDLPPEYRSLVHNDSMPGMDHGDQYDLLRFLVEQKGLLEAGAEKTLVVFGVSYHSTHNARLKGVPNDAFARSWTRRGFYRIDAGGTIRDSSQNSALNAMIVERTKLTGLLKELVNLAYTPLKRPRVQTPRQYIQEWTRVMSQEADWKLKIQIDTDDFARTVDYLSARNVKMAVVRMPRGSWDRDTLFEQAYIDKIRRICKPRNLKILDLSGLVPDEDFADSVHLTPKGIETFQGGVQELCFDHLRSAGVVPADSSGRRP